MIIVAHAGNVWIMNRPKREDYVIHYSFSYGSWDEFDSESYQEALNNYIDQLEKSFDKACEVLEMLRIWQEKDTLVIGAMSTIEDEKYMSKEEWKEWCMKDVD